MALWKRGKWYWADFTVNGERYRLPLKTTDERQAKREEKKAIAEAEDGRLTVSGQSFARLAFREAADLYLRDRVPYLATRTIQTERERAKPLKAVFGGTKLTSIGSDQIRQYRRPPQTGGYGKQDG